MSKSAVVLDSHPVLGTFDGFRRYGPRIQKSFEGCVSMTQQHFKDECDVNKILEKFRKTGVLTHVRNVQGQYGDFSVLPSYQEARNAIMAADDMFMTLPADVRKKFSNDAGEFLAFANNPSNKDEMIAMGLIPKPSVPVQPDISVEKDLTSSST